MRWLDVVMSKYVLLPLLVVLLFRPPRFLDRYNRFDLVFGILLLWISYWTVKAARAWKRYSPQEKGRYFKRLILFSSVLGFVALAWVLNQVMTEERYSTRQLGVLGNNAKGYELHTLEIYPFTGFHPRANCRVQGPMPLEHNPVYQDFDVRSGAYGFFVDFELENPPPKAENEFRIVLIGGSAAQGYGGQTNEHMLYRVLEKKLQSQFTQPALRVRVINLALANSQTYQNFVALNKWGHALQPDLILSFSGINDVTQPLMMDETDLPYRFEGVLGLTRSTWVTENPRLLEDAAKYFPALNTSLFGVAVRVFNSPELGRQAVADYCQSHHHVASPSPQEYVVRLYVHALQSIKRDFEGIPILVAFQPYRDIAPSYEDAYRYLTQRVPAQLNGYRNSKWYFRNVHEHFRRQNLLDDQHLCASVHLLNAGHEAAAEYLCQELLPIINEVRSAGKQGEPTSKGTSP